MGDRTKKSIFNISSNFTILMIKTILSFVTRTIFIKFLGEEALGLNGLFTNILSMLSLAELGISMAINFSLYTPLANNDKKTISALMSFYRKIYQYIGLIVLSLGLFLIPFLKYLIKDINQIDNVYLIYLLYLLNSTFSYFISYKETLIIADQKKYKLTSIEILGILITSIFQIIFLITTRSFIYYLIIQIVISFIQRIWINIYITREYSDIDFFSKEKLDFKEKEVIEKNIKAMFFHKIGDYCLNGTDNLIISYFINIVAVGIYSNYLVITGILNNIVSTIYNGITASVGNLIAVSNNDKKESLFNKIDFVGFVLYGFITICLINLFNDFIILWIGENFCLSFSIVLVISINFYLSGMRSSCHTFKAASGLFDVDKFTPLIQSIVNLVISIVLVKKIGLIGVLLGTLLSGVVLPNWQRPKLIYKYVFGKSSIPYFKNYIKNILFITVITLITLYLNSYIHLVNPFLTFVIKGIVCGIIYLFCFYFVFRKKEEFLFFKELIFSKIRK